MVRVKSEGMRYVREGSSKYRKTNWSVPVPSGEVMVEESGVPVQDDWSMAPDEERVRFSLSGVTPHCETMRAAMREELTASHHT